MDYHPHPTQWRSHIQQCMVSTNCTWQKNKHKNIKKPTEHTTNMKRPQIWVSSEGGMATGRGAEQHEYDRHVWNFQGINKIENENR